MLLCSAGKKRAVLFTFCAPLGTTLEISELVVIQGLQYLSEPFPFLSEKMLKKKETSDCIPSLVKPATMLGTVSICQ